MIQTARKYVSWIIGGLVIGIVAQIGAIWWLAQAPNSIVISAPNYHLIVRAGGMIGVEFTARRDRECVTETTRWLWRDDAGGRRIVVPLDYSNMAFGHEGNAARDYRFLFRIPVWLAPGEWTVRTLHADFCWPWSYTTGPRLRTSPPFGITVVGP